MANSASFLTAAHEPGTANTESGLTVEYWDVLGDASGPTVTITPKFAKRAIGCQCGSAAFSINTSTNVITLTFDGTLAAGHTVARVFGLP